MSSIEIKEGEIVNIDGKLYGLCADCRKIAHVNKPIFGGIHRRLPKEVLNLNRELEEKIKHLKEVVQSCDKLVKILEAANQSK